jgi:hypothetical protein
VDHTALKAVTTWEDVKKLCEEALRYGFASVCIPPCYVRRVKEAYGDKITVCTVIGFPLGYQVTPAKVAEASQAVADGAEEAPGWRVGGQRMPYMAYLREMVAPCSAIVDIVRPWQDGFTQRVMEALFYEKKLVTNNPAVREAPFYRPENVFLIGTDADLVGFLHTHMTKLPQDVTDYYRFDNFCDRIFSQNEA